MATREPTVRRGGALTAWKKTAFAVVATGLFFGALELVLAAAGVRPRLYEDDPYVGFSGVSKLFEKQRTPSGEEIWSTAESKLRFFNPQQFAAGKKPDTTRVFCVGGSTTFGRPYDDGTSFSGWLRELLPVAEPDRSWEVVNAGGVSYASYRVAMVMEELAAHDPDLFVIYTGHNEFLEERTYRDVIAVPAALRGLGALASRLRLATVIENVTDRVRSEDETPATVLQEEVTTLLDRAVGPAAYERDDELRRRVVEHFRYNLVRMVDIARAAGAEPVLVVPASNLRACTPFKSQHREGLTAAERSDWDRLVRQGVERLRAGDAEAALAALDGAAAVDSRHAELHYARGHALEALGRADRALEAFERARDEDVCPLRALGEISTIVREVAAERAVAQVDFDRIAAELADTGIPGTGLFLDHVHPTIEGHRRLALAIVEALADRGALEPGPGWNQDAVAEVTRRVAERVDPLDHALALMKLSKVLGWAGKIQEADRLARQAVARYPDDSRIQYQAGLTADRLGRVDDAVVRYRRAVEIQPDADLPHGDLGIALEKQGLVAEAIGHYREAVRYARSPATAQRYGRFLVDALVALGTERYGEGRPADAVPLFREAVELAPADDDVLARLALSQMAAGLGEDAAVSYQRLASRRPGDPAVHNRLAISLGMAGRPDEAVAPYLRAIRLDPSIPGSNQDAPRILAAQGFEDAAQALSNAAR